MKVIIAAAGTAGHINPGLAIANKIKKEEKNSEIIFIGTTRGLENDLVPRAGFELKTIEAYGLSKKISIENIKKMIKTYKGIAEAGKIIEKFKPDIVIGTGGYICGPVVMAANKRNIPIVLHESNAFPGKAVKMLAKKADCVLVSFEEAKSQIKNAKRIVYSGTPVKISKKEYSKKEKEKFLQQLDLNINLPTVLIFGGSQGAQKINEAILGILKNKLNDNYQIIWATGPKQYDIVKARLEKSMININNIKNIKIVPYIYNMEEIMNISDIIVARAGAMTITEISNLGKPSILIPLPHVSQNHQLHNAEVLEQIGAAEIIQDDDLTDEILNEKIKNITEDNNKIKIMGEKALTKSAKNVEDTIYSEIQRAIKRK